MEMRAVYDAAGRSYVIPAHILGDFEIAKPVDPPAKPIEKPATNGHVHAHESANLSAPIQAAAVTLGGYANPAVKAAAPQNGHPPRVLETVLGDAPVTVALGLLGDLARQRATSVAANSGDADSNLMLALEEPLLAKQRVTLRLRQLAELVRALRQ